MNQSIPLSSGPASAGVNIPQQQLSPMEQDEPEDPAVSSSLMLDQKLQNLINTHLTDPGILMMRKMFAPVAETLDCRDVLIAEACLMLDHLNHEDIFQVIVKTIERVKNAKGKERQQDDLLTDIIIGLHDNDLLSDCHALVLMVSSVDTRMVIPLSKKKIGFIKEKIAASNYKIVKEVLKAAFNEFSNLAPVITEQALDNFRPFEELLIGLLKRENNMAPGLMLQNEICRFNSNHQAYILKRLADSAGDIERSFRPLAIISEVIGRPYLFPVFGHPGITSTKQWVLDNSVHLHLPRFIPYSTDNHAPQTFFQYIMLKQPWYLLKQENPSGKEESSAPFQGFFLGVGNCTSVLLILILEAMAAMEETDLPMEHPLNQYNWQHLNEMCTCCLLGMQANFEQLLEMLHSQLRELKYRKARGELMKLLLQYVAIVVHARLDKARSLPDGFDFYGKLRDLYLLLYPEERFEPNVAATNECLKFVRYFAPAAIWINLSALPNVQIDQPSNLTRLIQIIKEILESDKNSEEVFGTIVANAYTADNAIFMTKFCHNVICKLENPKTSIILPYGKQGVSGNLALDIAFLESLNVCACQQLLQFLYDHINKYLADGNLPSPALIESLARIHSISDVKGATVFLYKEFKDISNASLLSPTKITKLMILCEYFSIRIKVLSEMSIYSQFILCIHDVMRMMTDDPRYLNCYFALQMQLIRWFLWCPPYAFCQNAQIMVTMYKNQGARHQTKFNVFKKTDSFRKGETICSSEVMKIYLLQYLRTTKLTNMSIENNPVSELIQDFDKNVIMYQQVPSGSKKWIPESFKDAVVCEGLEPMDELIQCSNQDIEAHEIVNDNHFKQRMQSKIPSLFIALFRILYEEPYKSRQLNFPYFSYEILKFMSARYMIVCTSALVDFILYSLKQSGLSENVINDFCKILNSFIFEYQFLTLDKFLFQLVVHPNDDESIKNSIIFLKYFVTNNNFIDQRFKFLIDFLPSFQQMPFCNSSKFFNGIQEYYKKFPEYTYLEMTKKDKEIDPIIESEHLPIYYCNLMEQLLPTVEFLFQRLIEQEISANIFVPLMEKFIFVFKYHPQPAIYLYRTLYSFPSELIRHDWIRKCIRQIALLDRDHKQIQKYCILSENFIDRFDVASPIEICSLLIDRISKATTYKHQPPYFCARDWRFAELPPAAATLVGANIEFMISKFEPEILVDSLINYAFKKPLEKPFDVMNSIGLILTTVPEKFQKYFIKKCENFIYFSELLEEDNPEILLKSFVIDGFLGTDNDPITGLTIIHSFSQHCSNGGLPLISQLVENIHKKITTESQLLFMMRIVVPILHRITDLTKLNFITCIFKAITTISKKKQKLNYEDTYCDFIYEIKYTVLGIMGIEKLENLILQFPENLKEKMKYFHSSKEERDAAMAKQKEKILQQHVQQRSQQHIQQQNQQQNQQYNQQQNQQYNQQQNQQLVQQQNQQQNQQYNQQLVQSKQLQNHPSFQNSIQQISNFSDNRSIRILTNSNVGQDMGIKDKIEIGIKEKIEPEMVAPAVRADSLPEMGYQQTIIRTPDGQNVNQNRQPGMRSGIIQNMGNLPPMTSQSIPGMNMNPMHRMQQMGPSGNQMSSMMPPNFVPSNTTNMNLPQHGGFMQSQPSMYMAPGTSGGQISQSNSDGIVTSGPPPFGMMNSGYPGNPMPQGNQIPMGMPNQGGLIGPPNMMNQASMGPPHMMTNPQNYPYNQNIRQPMPPFQPGMLPPR